MKRLILLFTILFSFSSFCSASSPDNNYTFAYVTTDGHNQEFYVITNKYIVEDNVVLMYIIIDNKTTANVMSAAVSVNMLNHTYFIPSYCLEMPNGESIKGKDNVIRQYHPNSPIAKAVNIILNRSKSHAV